MFTEEEMEQAKTEVRTLPQPEYIPEYIKQQFKKASTDAKKRQL